MGASLSLSISESSIDKAANTSKVKATLYVKSTSGSWNGDSRYGYIEIDGSKHTFHSSFKSNTTTTLSSYTKTVKHDSDGGGKITIKGYYQTGVSAGNISISKTHTLDKIDRTFSVKYSANGGTGAPSSQTKTYGKTLTLRTGKPTRKGYNFVKWNTKSNGTGKDYKPGGSYTSNSDVTLYAIWEEISYTINLSTNNTFKFLKVIYVRYNDTTSTWGETTPMDGWYSDGWVTSSGDFLPNGSKIQSTPGYAEIYHNTTVNAHELQYTSTVTYKYNGSEIVSEDLETEFHYNDLVNLKDPTKIINPISIPEDKEFEGWETDSGKLYKVGESISWTSAKSGDDSITLNVKLKDKDKVNVYYNSLLSIDDTDLTEGYIDTNSVIYGGSHKVKDLSQLMNNTVNGFKFAGYWKIGSKPVFDDFEIYNLPNQYLFPYNFEPVFDEDHYNSEYGLVEAEYDISNITSNIELYPVYKDVTSSGVKLANSYRDYIDKSDYEEKDVKEEYFSYLTNKISSFSIVLLGEYFVAAWKLQLPNDTELNTSNVQCNVYEIGNENNNNNSVTTTVAVNYNVENDIRYCYIIVTNEVNTIDPSKKYLLKLSGIKDYSNKDVVVDDITISAPNIIRDINKTGSVVSFFGAAANNPTKSNNIPEFWINGNLILTGEIFTESESDENENNNNYGLKQAITIVASAVKYIEDKMNENGWKQGYTDGLDDISSGKF